MVDISSSQIEEFNAEHKREHNSAYIYLAEELSKGDIHVGELVSQIAKFQVAIPSWALGAGGTRFGRFPMGGEPGNLEEKIQDVGIIHALNSSSGAISLHIPWDIPDDTRGREAVISKV